MAAGSACALRRRALQRPGAEPYSEWSTHTIGDRAFPTLKIPTDPLGMATGRWLYRKFDNGSSEPIAYLPDNVQSQHTDSRD